MMLMTHFELLWNLNIRREVLEAISHQIDYSVGAVQ